MEWVIKMSPFQYFDSLAVLKTKSCWNEIFIPKVTGVFLIPDAPPNIFKTVAINKQKPDDSCKH